MLIGGVLTDVDLSLLDRDHGTVDLVDDVVNLLTGVGSVCARGAGRPGRRTWGRHRRTSRRQK